MANRLALLSLLFALCCGGSARRALPPPPQPPATVPRTTDADPARPLPRADISPSPALGSEIRVGLSTSASVVRLTASRPFRIGAAGVEIDTADVVVETESSGAPEGWTYRVQVASYPDSQAAGTARTSLREELEQDVSLARETVTGRYALRIGAYATLEGAEAARLELVRNGFAGAETVREPTLTAASSALVLHPRDRSPIRIVSSSLRAVPASEESFLEIDGSPYRGYLEIDVNATSHLTLVNVIALEQYLRGVVPAELSPDVFPEKEALKAQAIAARTYAVKRMGEYVAEGFDICATPACQVYRGVSVERRMSDEAVRETEGQILTYDGEPVDALYTSTCGGRTEAAENVFSTPAPYLVSRACALEGHPPELESANGGPRSLEAAVLDVSGVRHEDLPSTPQGLRELVSRVMSKLGQRPCAWTRTAAPGETLDVVLLATTLADALCWERRAPFLMSAADARSIVASDGLTDEERFDLAYSIREGLVRPDREGVRRGTALDRRDVVETIYRVLAKYGAPPLEDAATVSVEPGRVTLLLEQDGQTELPASFARETFFFREVEGATYYEPRITLLPNDRVSFHLGEDGIDLLVVHSTGASFDRSSRFSHWTVRRTAKELSAQVSAHENVGDVLFLRPLRYGQSGRVAELEIVGTKSSATVRGLAIRRVLGLRENLFFFDRQAGADGAPLSWVFTGRGWGHGVGLCQVGAYGMAASGYDYRAILAHYYPGTKLFVDKD